MSLILKVFGHKPKYWMKKNFNTIMASEEK